MAGGRAIRSALPTLVTGCLALLLCLATVLAPPAGAGMASVAAPTSTPTPTAEAMSSTTALRPLDLSDPDPTLGRGRVIPVAPSPTPATLGDGWFVSPVPDPNPTGYGMRFHPILHVWRMHNGDDLHADCGQTVVAAASGTVSFAGWNGGYGFLVSIDHGVHADADVATNYAHLSVIGVRDGQQVTMGQPIGLAGTTGLSTACHLHFEVLVNGAFVDPTPYLTGKPSPTATTQVPDLTPVMPVDAATFSALPIKDRIRFCESRNDYKATNRKSTASGAYQFLDSTWRGIPGSITGGTKRALDASPAQQDAAFDWLYARQGTTPWLASEGCWSTIKEIPATSPTLAPSVTPTLAPTPSPTTAPSPSEAPTPSASADPPAPGNGATPTPSTSASPAVTESPAVTPTPTATTTATPTASATPTATPSATTSPTSATPTP